jgi:hypothetical protein
MYEKSAPDVSAQEVAKLHFGLKLSQQSIFGVQNAN